MTSAVSRYVVHSYNVTRCTRLHRTTYVIFRDVAKLGLRQTGTGIGVFGTAVLGHHAAVIEGYLFVVFCVVDIIVQMIDILRSATLIKATRRYSRRGLYILPLNFFLPRTVIAARRRSGGPSKVYHWLGPRCRHKMTLKYFANHPSNFTRGQKVRNLASISDTSRL